jgi:hypothetical protein
MDQGFDTSNISNQWSVPEENGPKKCPNWNFCKGLKSSKNNANKTFKTHTTLLNCPYQDFLVSKI